MKTQTLVMQKRKETTNTTVYGTNQPDAAVSVVYVNNTFLGGTKPDAIEMTVTIK